MGLIIGGLTASADLSFASPEGIWAQLAIYIMFSAFILEHRFTGGAPAAANAVVVVFVYLAAPPSHLHGWWNGLLALALLSLLSNLASYATAAEGSRSSRRKLLGKFARVTGSWRVLPLLALVVALLTFNTPFGPEWGLGALVIFYTFAATTLPPHEVFQSLFKLQLKQTDGPSVVAVFPPSEILIAATTEISPGDTLQVKGRAGAVEGIVVQETFMGGMRCWRAVAPDLRLALPRSPTNDGFEHLHIEMRQPTSQTLKDARDALKDDGAECVGVLAEGSRVRSALFELSPGTRSRVGELLWTLTEDGPTYWQVTDAEVKRASWSGDTRRATIAETAQIGRWKSETLAFEVDTTSPDSAALAFRGGRQGRQPVGPDRADTYVVGTLVGSSFPVLVHLVPLSRQHAAILGTTGTGKTHLAFGLAAALSAAGSRVICIDQTGQYSDRFPGAPVLQNTGEVDAFLSGQEGMAVLTPEATDPVTVVNAVARRLLDRYRQEGGLASDELARCVVIIDEAQNFVPEGFVINDWELKAKAQDTSRVLMESRKFGLGFILISQRTAMVTKSALSQCNTVMAFQAVDQTGLDYLEGLCGRTHAAALPTLPHRSAIVMGQGLASNAPVISYVEEAATVVG